jgi:uncharacterized RDD family membrane protein YckC
MYQELLVYLLTVVVIVFSLAQGGFVLSMAAVIGIFYFMDITRRRNPSVGKRMFIVSVIASIILVVSFFTSLV